MFKFKSRPFLSCDFCDAQHIWIPSICKCYIMLKYFLLCIYVFLILAWCWAQHANANIPSMYCLVIFRQGACIYSNAWPFTIHCLLFSSMCCLDIFLTLRMPWLHGCYYLVQNILPYWFGVVSILFNCLVMSPACALNFVMFLIPYHLPPYIILWATGFWVLCISVLG